MQKDAHLDIAQPREKTPRAKTTIQKSMFRTIARPFRKTHTTI